MNRRTFLGALGAALAAFKLWPKLLEAEEAKSELRHVRYSNDYKVTWEIIDPVVRDMFEHATPITYPPLQVRKGTFFTFGTG